MSQSWSRPRWLRYHLAALVASADDAIISKTLDGTIQTWNEGAEKILGYAAHEIIGKPIFTLIPPELHEEEHEILRKIRRGERVSHFDTVRVTKDGRRVDVSLTISPINDRKGRIVGASKILRDVTDRKKAEQERLASSGSMCGRFNPRQ